MTNKAQSQSSRTNSPSIANDPLSRPTDTSSSTPLSPARRSATTKSSPSSSIFGDIDVSKLGTTNGKKHTVRSPALRSKQYDVEDEEDLFGGGGHRTRKSSKAATPTPSVKSPTVQQQDIPAVKKTSASPPPPSLPSPSPVIQQQKPPVAQQKQPTVSKPVMELPVEQPARNETSAPKEEKPTVSSSSSSFFRFFKSSNNNSNTNSKNSSSASSIASVNAPSPIVAKNHDTVNSTSTTTTTPVLPPAPPARQAVPALPSLSQQQKPIHRPNDIQQQQEEEEEGEEEEEEEAIPIIEDEATRAFAEDNVISFKPSLLHYRSISPELTMDALKIDIPTSTHTTATKKLVPSISTPTNNVDDPWSNPLLMQPTVEPSVSSPLVVKVQDIEPQKRTAFADLINSWNTGKSNNKEYTNNQDPKEFFDHVAEERRDIGFAGIREHDDDEEEEEEHYHRQQLDYQDEINPWN